MGLNVLSLAALALVWQLADVRANSYGPPYDACDNMMPSHDDYTPHTGNGGFAIQHDICGGYGRGESYTMTITGERPFKGFFCRGQFQGTHLFRDAAGFYDSRRLPRFTRTSVCAPSPKDGVSHIRVMNTKRLEIGFFAPDDTRPFYFRCTFVESKHRFFYNVTSELIQLRPTGRPRTPCGAAGAPAPGSEQCSCQPGAQGPRGAKGEKGRAGYSGLTGRDGPQGVRGQKGERGVPGRVMRIPSTGSVGEKGDRGPRGPIGQKGEPGTPGLQGSPGPVGPPGPFGPEGARGLRGQKGEKGFPGLAIPGLNGEKGNRGFPGPPGPPGSPGASSLSQSSLNGFKQSVNSLESRVSRLESLTRNSSNVGNEIENVLQRLYRVLQENYALESSIEDLKDQILVIQNLNRNNIGGSSTEETEPSIPVSCSNCNSPLGITSGNIRASQITASSHVTGLEASKARMSGTGWMPRSKSGEYIQVDLGSVKTITSVETMGRTNPLEVWVKRFRVMYSTENTEQPQNWEEYKECPGNTDGVTSVWCRFCSPPLRARHIRLMVLNSQYWPGLKFELYGCPVYSV